MINRKRQHESKFTFINLLLVSIFIGVLIIIVGNWWIIKNSQNNSEDKKTIRRIKSDLIKAQNQANKNKENYKLKFIKNTMSPKYLNLKDEYFPISSVGEVINYAPFEKVSSREINFDSNGNAKPSKIIFIISNGKQCFIINNDTKEIKEEKDEKC